MIKKTTADVTTLLLFATKVSDLLDTCGWLDRSEGPTLVNILGDDSCGRRQSVL